MGRSPRIDWPGGRYHVMNRGVAGQVTFFGQQDRVEFGRLLGVGHQRFGVTAHAYCLMDNHYHLVLHCPSSGLSDVMHLLGSVYTRHVNERVGRDGPLFRGRFKSIPIRSDRQLLATVRYVHRNALDLPGVSRVDDYRWSSHRAYLGHRRSPAWLDTDLVLGMLGDDTARFHRFVADGVAPTTMLVAVDEIPAIIDLVAEEHAETIGPGVRRTLMLLLLDHLADPHRRDLERMITHAHSAALDRARRRAARRALEEPWLAEIVERALALARCRPSCA